MILIVENAAFTLQTIGALFVAYAALRVHHRVLSEHKIDKKVLHTMHAEQIVGWVGVVFIIFGYFTGLYLEQILII